MLFSIKNCVKKAAPTFISVLSIILKVVHWKPEPAISMLYAIHECHRTHASMHCNSENTSSQEFTRPIRIALNVMSDIWGREHGTTWRAEKRDSISVIRKWLDSSDVLLVLTSNEGTGS